MTYVLIAMTSFIATVFAVAFVNKVRGVSFFHRFEAAISHLAVLSPRLARSAAAGIVLGEGATVALLVSSGTRGAGFALAITLLACFIAVAVRAVRSGVIAECRCFGRGGSVMSTGMIVRNVILIIAAAAGLAATGSAAPVGPAGWSVAVAGVLVAALYIRYYDDVVRAVARHLPPTTA
ncbi:MauE/DoxX family redox-associated membrane protein [Streptosporangium sp. NPDC006930]|uniref:MauE/DoxX family redox-associated membrane protein n=1 Tax=unclassified Streptosporangium TaxID=2632669 RepID=UPI003428F533